MLIRWSVVRLSWTLGKLTEFLIDKIIEDFPKYTTIKGTIYSELGSLALADKKARTEEDATYSIEKIKSLK